MNDIAAGQPDNYVTRMETELAQLRERTMKLSAFISSSISKELPRLDQFLLNQQLTIMTDYADVLSVRIGRAKQ